MKTARQYMITHKLHQLIMNNPDAYVEIPFREITIDDDGTVWSSTGTEDFTSRRWLKCVERRYIYIPTGELDRGGHRRWEINQAIICRSVSECRTMANHIMAGTEFQLRQH